ncbi:MAG TPA: hydroxymethylbilane synthase, partial [Bryobacteraceae bacterium]|nr:hydroxymethylbilane synthase [Bryobacteraceae bacterium]
EEALLDRSIDIAVHSLKDMPTELPAGLRIAATPEREDPRDVLIGATLDQLPRGAKVGTGSLRRIAQLAAARPDLKLMPIRGNVDTRLRKLDGKEFDAIVLAAAGLRRLGWAERITEYLPVEVMCPAVGQGALAIETRADGEAAEICAALNHPETNAAVSAERAVLGVLGGGCQVPVGAHASVSDAKLTLRAVVISTDGRAIVRQFTEGSVEEAERIGRLCGEALLESGAAEILEAVYGS